MEVAYNATKAELIRTKEAVHVEKMEKLSVIEQLGGMICEYKAPSVT